MTNEEAEAEAIDEFPPQQPPEEIDITKETIYEAKFVSGETIVSALRPYSNKEGTLFYSIIEPFQTFYVPAGNGKIDIQLMPFMPYSEHDGILINAIHFMFIVKAGEKLSNSYKKNILRMKAKESGIILPDDMSPTVN